MHNYEEQTIVSDNKTANRGRQHDPCVVPRAVPIVEAMAALVLVDFMLVNKRLNYKSIF